MHALQKFTVALLEGGAQARMALDVKEIAQTGKAKEAPLVESIAKVVEKEEGRRPTKALALTPEQPPTRTGQLFRFLTILDAKQRIARLQELIDVFRKELPGALHNTPLRPGHFGFNNYDQFAAYIAGEPTPYVVVHWSDRPPSRWARRPPSPWAVASVTVR